MKSLWNSFKVAFAMFSKIPVPQADWTKENMKYMFCFFPFIGTVIGGLTMAAVYLGQRFSFDKSFTAVVLVLIPVLVTGGIHVDGLLDTSDAMSSWQERSRRLEILKDSNAGAFAVITAGVYFLAWFGAYSQMWENFTAVTVMAAGFMVSRCLSGIGVILFPKAKAEGTVAEFSRKSADTAVRNVLVVFLVLLFCLMVWIQPVMGTVAFAVALLVFAYYYHMAMKYFGGTTGDLSGCFLCLCEVGMALALAVVSNFC
ncbi:MAG: adenosylcobinamide-GDP ribazoletransferase [Eubacteriales bacterium]|nr:adenosylcobinamide-GDP ribazoletransferase [Eubacteriales bacterium]